MQNRPDSDILHEFSRICHAHQLKITPQRIAIFKQLSHLGTHPTADAVFQLVKSEYPNISFDTVNRTLLTFAKIGIVDVVETFGGARRYDPNLARHHHLHCSKCGRVFDIYNQSYDNLAVPEKILEQFQITDKRVILKGVCKACRKKIHQSS
jgi:Fur family peroxide stress response transcriptional regulator